MKVTRRAGSQELMARGLPFGYGVAWPDPARDAWILAPLPLNVLFRWVRRAWRWLRQGPAVWLYPERDSPLWSRVRALEAKFEEMDDRVRNVTREVFR